MHKSSRGELVAEATQAKQNDLESVIYLYLREAFPPILSELSSGGDGTPVPVAARLFILG